MKIIRQKRDGAYVAMVNSGYCCDNAHLMRGIMSFCGDGKYSIKHGESRITTEVRFCPFCGEKIDIIKE